MRKLSPDTAELLAQYWSASKSIDLPMEYYVRYFRDTLSTLDVLGIYEDSNEDHPVSWAGVRPGKYS